MQSKIVILIVAIALSAFVCGFYNSYQKQYDNKAVVTFVETMNDKAQSLGMYDTQFCDPTGLSYCNTGSAIDVITLLKECAKDSIINSVWCKDSSTIQILDDDFNTRSVTMYNTFPSDSVKDMQVFGRKTGSDGYIFNLGIVFEKDEDLLYVAILNCDSEEERLNTLRDLTGVFDVSDRNIACYEKSGEGKIPLLSITKLMTVLLIKDVGIDGESIIEIKETDLMRGSGINLTQGDKLTLSDAIEASLISSSNTASYAVARVLGRKLLQQNKFYRKKKEEK